MKKYRLALLLIISSAIISNKVSAQSSVNALDQISIVVQDICLIETNNAPVNMTLSTSVAGSSVLPVSNSDMFVKITSIVASGTTRKITARVTSNEIPHGTLLTLAAAPCTSANSKGNRGTAVTVPVILNTTDQTIVDGIASCYTGTGYTDGYRLTFTWKPDSTNYYLINATRDPKIITVTFTIMSNI